MYQVTKRDGKVVDFNIEKIDAAITKAFEATGTNYTPSVIHFLSLMVTAEFQPKIQNDLITVEDVQDSVEAVLSRSGYEGVAKAYILYRKQREKVRNVNSALLNYKDLVDDYLQINDWRVKDVTPWGDLKLSGDWSLRRNFGKMKFGMVGAVSYTDEARTYTDMTNNLYGVYDAANDRSNYLRQSTDNQYNRNSRLGGMLNLALLSPSGRHKYELKNIVNRLTNRRYTDRSGINAQSDNETGAEYYYRSRLTTNTQLTGKHAFDNDQIEWSGSYSFANRLMPDRRRYTIDDALERGTMMLTAGNEINREFTKLGEHIASVNVSDSHTFSFMDLKVGAYGEYRSRKYTTRQFIYSWNMEENNLPSDFRTMDMTELLSDEQYFGDDKLYLIEEKCMRNNYKGNNLLGAGYVSAVVPLGRWDVNAGVRYEHNSMELITNTRDELAEPFLPQQRHLPFAQHDVPHQPPAAAAPRLRQVGQPSGVPRGIALGLLRFRPRLSCSGQC